MNTPDPQLPQQLDAQITSFNEAVTNNDATAVAANFTEDAVFITDRGPVYGRQAIEKWYADSFKEFHRKNFVAKADQYSPHVIGTAGSVVWKTENGARLFKRRAGRYYISRAIGRRFPSARVIDGKTEC